jgi:hypothetical protein
MGLRSPDMAKMDANAADMALAVWNGYVRDARRHAGQWRPVEQVLQGSKDVSLGARARSRTSLCETSSKIFSRSSLSEGVYATTKEF